MNWDDKIATEEGMRVPWESAKFEDNSGDEPTIVSIPASSSRFEKGVNQVRYSAMVSITLVIYFTK